MCGIFGLSICRNNTKQNLNKKTLFSIIETLAKKTEPRGRQATGIAIVEEDYINVIKKPVNASNFMGYSEVKEKINSINISKLYSIIGHCRMPTQGSKEYSENNHPIIAGNTVGVHNGVITNDDLLFEKYKGIINREAEVDSEIIFKLFDYFSNTLKYSYDKVISVVSSELDGTAAYVCTSAFSPSSIFFIRKTVNPIKICFFKKYGLILYASTTDAIEEVKKKLNIGINEEEIKVEPSSAITLCLDTAEYSYTCF